MIKLKIIIYLSFFITVISCDSYKFIYMPITEYENINKLDKINSKSIKYNELYLTFTKTYKNFKIRLYENDTIKFNSYITTGRNDVYGIAKAFKVNKNSKILIYFEGIKKPLEISNEQMKNYKFIYLEKKKSKIIVEFNNSTKKFN